ncbi:MAG: hypothetical protein DI533_17645 [Cereibacter sphaeroides]|uniref:Uncharacterized protein n=1 Tax=Cereibacter sphaeroides TaxID=1063 RepID=A0A2W5S719_CERSP|nr:MAG: hypothetical protein DI533_17645 [Cereibacter sphaeroides]
MGVSLNQFIALALAGKVGATRAAGFFAERGQGADAERVVAWLQGRPGLRGRVRACTHHPHDVKWCVQARTLLTS